MAKVIVDAMGVDFILIVDIIHIAENCWERFGKSEWANKQTIINEKSYRHQRLLLQVNIQKAHMTMSEMTS